MKRLTFAMIVGLSLSVAATFAQQTATGAHHLDARGKSVMGFDQQKTTHHFLLFEDGGAIDVAVKDPKDAENLKAIRSHLPHITHLFADGQFDAPMLVHDRKDVPGTAELARLKDQLYGLLTEEGWASDLPNQDQVERIVRQVLQDLQRRGW